MYQTTEEARKRKGLAHKGEKNWNWKGDKAKYRALHSWVNKHKNKKAFCELCKQTKPLELANKTGVYNRDFDNWFWLCYKCHKNYDAERRGHKNKSHFSKEQIESRKIKRKNYLIKYKSKNKEKIKKQNAEYREANRDIIKQRNKRYREKKKNNMR